MADVRLGYTNTVPWEKTFKKDQKEMFSAVRWANMPQVGKFPPLGESANSAQFL